jgi:hypothetical protein
MEWALGIWVVVGMILLRLMVPLAITVALCYALRRLDAHWHPDEPGENLPQAKRSKISIREEIPSVGRPG